MKKLTYSPEYRKKLIEMKKYLDLHFGEKIRKKTLRSITDRLHMLQEYEESGVSLKAIYGIETDYRYAFIAHSYIFYRIESDYIRIVDIFNEREDFLLTLFGINSVSEEGEAYWNEIERNHE